MLHSHTSTILHPEATDFTILKESFMDIITINSFFFLTCVRVEKNIFENLSFVCIYSCVALGLIVNESHIKNWHCSFQKEVKNGKLLTHNDWRRQSLLRRPKNGFLSWETYQELSQNNTLPPLKIIIVIIKQKQTKNFILESFDK